MIEIQLSKKKSANLFITFDGKVIQYFSLLNIKTSVSASGMIKVETIKSIEIVPNPNGKQSLVIITKSDAKFSNDEFDDEVLDQVKELVAEVQRAMQDTASS
jgi:hypothetical protein